MITTKLNSIADSQKIRKKESKHTTTENHEITNADSKKRRSRGTAKQPENN